MTDTIDTVVKDGKKVANKAVKGFATVGGVIAGVGLSVADMKFAFVDDLLGAIGLDNDWLAKALTIVVGIMIVAALMTVKNLVSSSIAVAIFTFLAVMMGVWLAIYAIRLVIGAFKKTGGVAA